MDRNYNRQEFRKDNEEQVKQFYDFLNILMISNDNNYNDLHIYQDDFDYVIEWVQNNWTDEYGSNAYWKLLSCEDEIFTTIDLPDGSYQWIPKGTEDEFLKEWLEENPGWTKTDYGTWINKEENDKMMKEIYNDLGKAVGIKEQKEIAGDK